MLKGARKAIVRAPHRLAGSKSIEDRIIIEWTKDFHTAENAIDFLISEITKFHSTWKVICQGQAQLAQQFKALYEPIVEDNVYSMTQETPESSMIAMQGYLDAVKQIEDTIIPLLVDFEAPFVARCKTAKDCINSVHKALKKRERKKMDFDRFSNSVEKILKKKTALTDKEQQELAKAEMDLDTATEVFHALDEKVKSTIPYVLTTMSEFLNPLTSQLYLTQFKVYKAWTEILFAYAQTQGLAGTLLSVSALGKPFVLEDNRHTNGDPDTYESIAEAWETQFMTLQPRCEQGLKTIRDGKAITKSMKENSSIKEEKDAEHSSSTLPVNINFSSPQGLFWTEADLLASSSSFYSYGSHSNSRAGSTPSSPVFTPVSRNVSASHRSMLGPNGNSPIGAGSAGFSNGRSPVTTAIEPPLPTEQHLLTRVRASLSTAARTLSPPNAEEEGLMGIDNKTNDDDYDDDENDSLKQQMLRRRSHSKAGSIQSNSTAAATVTPPSSNGQTLSPDLDHLSVNRTRFSVGSNNLNHNGSTNEQAVALFTFPGEEPGDVAFRVGDRLKVLDHGTLADDQWWFGQTTDGRLGLFPRNYVEICK